MKQLLLKKLETLSKITEIKRIFSTIETSMKKPKNPCIVVTSGKQGEGKTTLTAGLAISAAEQNGNRVLIVDYNWHTPSLHEYFGLDMFNDVEEMNGGRQIEELVGHTYWKNLDVIPAVNNFQGDNHSSGWHLDLLTKARKSYDYVFVDTHSVFPANYRMLDPLLISNAATGVLLVALANVTPKQVVKRASVAMETSGASLLGVVANNWKNPIA
jgi:Mrp family chromosome partitioning ATPase